MSDFDSILEIFDSWESIVKARKAKGLAKWDKLISVAHKLEGKQKSHITFTCAHHSHPGETHVLGSTMGNLHFLLGYCSPAFHLAVYHFQVMDPTIDDEEAEELYFTRGHPAKPFLWEESELSLEEEGDLEEGEPHPSYETLLETELDALEAEEGITVTSGAGKYTAYPSKNVVVGNHNNQVYHWSMVKESFLAAANPDLVEEMDLALELEEPIEEEEKEKEIGKALSPYLLNRLDTEYNYFAAEVYPFVKSCFPQPGSLLKITETLRGVVTPTSVKFFDQEGRPVKVKVYDHMYSSFDLTEKGNTYPSVLLDFAKSLNLGVDFESLESWTSTGDVGSSSIVKGTPTPWFDYDYVDDPEYKVIEIVGNTTRLVPRKING